MEDRLLPIAVVAVSTMGIILAWRDNLLTLLTLMAGSTRR